MIISSEQQLELDAADEAWHLAQYSGGCNCMHNPPCSFCVDGFSLELDEYLELYLEVYERDIDKPQIIMGSRCSTQE